MSGFPAARVSVQTAWMSSASAWSPSICRSVWAFVVTRFTRTLAEKLCPPFVDRENQMSWFMLRPSTQAIEMLFPLSRAREGFVWAKAVASLFTRTGGIQVRPFDDFVKKTSVPVVGPAQPAKARYATPSEPTAMEGFPAVYAGAWVIITFGPKCGVAGAAPARGMETPRTADARRATTARKRNVRRTERTRARARRFIFRHSRGIPGSHTAI